VTHVFKGFDRIEEALMLMKDKPRDLIKPVSALSNNLTNIFRGPGIAESLRFFSYYV